MITLVLQKFQKTILPVISNRVNLAYLYSRVDAFTILRNIASIIKCISPICPNKRTASDFTNLRDRCLIRFHLLQIFIASFQDSRGSCFFGKKRVNERERLRRDKWRKERCNNSLIFKVLLSAHDSFASIFTK